MLQQAVAVAASLVVGWQPLVVVFRLAVWIVVGRPAVDLKAVEVKAVDLKVVDPIVVGLGEGLLVIESAPWR